MVSVLSVVTIVMQLVLNQVNYNFRNKKYIYMVSPSVMCE